MADKVLERKNVLALRELQKSAEEKEMEEQFCYDAFLSYSHRDLAWGKWLQKRLEAWQIPAEVRQETSIARKKLKIFRDQTDLAGVELRETIRQELRASRFLIVLCSPNSAVSPWVAEEIAYFKALGRENAIIPFIIEGEPETDRAELECYSEELRNLPDKHFLGANVQELGRNKAFLRLVSILLNVRFDRLVDRDRRSRIRRWLIIGSGTAVIAAVTGGLLWQNRQVTKQNQVLSYEMYGSAIVSFAQSDTIDETGVAALTISAEAGNPSACMLLADCYKNGRGIAPDAEQAFSWYQKAAELGDASGMIALANCYRDGIGTEKNAEQAFSWDVRAAELEDPSAMFNVAICYEDGLGTEADAEKAFQWYSKAAEGENVLAMYNLARCYLRGVGTAEDPQQAFYWMKNLAQTGDITGMYNLALMYQNGFGTEESPEEALHWYRKAAEAGDADAMYMVGWCLENNYGTICPALDWYQRAAAAGKAEAVEAMERLKNGMQQ